MTSNSPMLLWFRQDLRLSDNPALAAAVEQGKPIIPVFIWAPEEEGMWRPGGASSWWLHYSLNALADALEKRGSKLVIRRGPAASALQQLLAESGASSVFWNRRYEREAIARDTKLKAELKKSGIQTESFNSSLLFEPWTIQNSSSQPFRVFTPFWKACLSRPCVEAAADAPANLQGPDTWPSTLALAELKLESNIDWASGLREAWQPGESGALRELQRFQTVALDEYQVSRDKPGVAGTSRLSPHLHFGEISPGQIWRALKQGGHSAASDAYLRQLGWREFAHHVLYHFPNSPQQALRPEFAAFPWKTELQSLQAWTQGKTGYPLVDAGMRELWHTGWMHNRVRMVVASFLVKHLLTNWQEGAAWFWDTLVDADLANNTLGWQWVAGCGADAAPYFRIFNPVIQGEKFDPDGSYVRRWVPELAALPDEWLHKPWKAPTSVLAQSGIELGSTYPAPIVDHDQARSRALAALSAMREKYNTPERQSLTSRI